MPPANRVPQIGVRVGRQTARRGRQTSTLPRGLTRDELLQLERKRTFKIIATPDKDQCIYSLDDVPTNGKVKCYICDASLVPNYRNFRTKCRDLYNRDQSEFQTCPWIKESNTYDDCNSECDHIIPCKSANKLIRPWLLHIMIHCNYAKLMRNHDSIIQRPDGELTRRYVENIIRPYIDSQNTAENKKIIWFLHVILRINYAWAHRVCNGTKSNTDFITHRLIRNKKKLYPIQPAALKRILTDIIDNGKKRWEKGIYQHFTNVKTYKLQAESPRVPANLNILPTIPAPSTNANISQRFIQDKPKLIKRACDTTTVRTKLLCELYNDDTIISNIENYVLPQNNALLEPLQQSGRRARNPTGPPARRVRRRVVTRHGGGLNPDSDLLTFIENIERKRECISIIKYLKNHLKNFEYEENSMISEFNNIFDMILLPESASEYDKDLLTYIDDLYETKCFKIMLLLLTYDFKELEKVEENSYEYYYNNCIRRLDNESFKKELKDNYIKFITFNYQFKTDDVELYESKKELYKVAEQIYEETSTESLIYQSYIISFFKKVLINIYEDYEIKREKRDGTFKKITEKNAEKDLYKISQMFFKTCVSFGLLYNKTPADQVPLPETETVVEPFLESSSKSSSKSSTKSRSETPVIE